MLCPKCGTQIPDDAVACWKCGSPQKAGKAESHDNSEYCTITLERDPNTLAATWVAWEGTSRGNKKIASSRTISSKQYAKSGSLLRPLSAKSQEWEKTLKEDKQALDLEHSSFIKRLKAQGWAVLATDREGYVTTMNKVT